MVRSTWVEVNFIARPFDCVSAATQGATRCVFSFRQDDQTLVNLRTTPAHRGDRANYAATAATAPRQPAMHSIADMAPQMKPTD
jgi:hypothetical protein